MDTVTQYIGALFARLPATLEILHLKDDVMTQAREDFSRLREGGMSENEAAGAVLSSLGSLEEIFARHGVPMPGMSAGPLPDDYDAGEAPYVYEAETLDEETEDYLDAQFAVARMNGLGVGLCICSVVFPILFGEMPYWFGHYISDGLGACALFGCIAAAVMLFIYGGSIQKRWRAFPYTVRLTAGMREELRRREADYNTQRTSSVAMGIGLCIFSPALPIMLDTLGAALMFIAVAMGIYMMIISGVRAKACRKLLKYA